VYTQQIAQMLWDATSLEDAVDRLETISVVHNSAEVDPLMEDALSYGIMNLSDP